MITTSGYEKPVRLLRREPERKRPSFYETIKKSVSGLTGKERSRNKRLIYKKRGLS